jgi:hypothetical protein
MIDLLQRHSLQNCKTSQRLNGSVDRVVKATSSNMCWNENKVSNNVQRG